MLRKMMNEDVKCRLSKLFFQIAVSYRAVEYSGAAYDKKQTREEIVRYRAEYNVGAAAVSNAFFYVRKRKPYEGAQNERKQ